MTSQEIRQSIKNFFKSPWFIGITCTIIGPFLSPLIKSTIGLDLSLYIANLQLTIILLLVLLLLLVLFTSKKNEENNVENKLENKKMLDIFKQLSSKIGQVSWTSNLAKHDSNVFHKMSTLLKDPSITGMDVLSIFHKEEIPSPERKQSIIDYYKAIENAVKYKKFRYRRALVVREELAKKKKTNKKGLFLKRDEFNTHWKNIYQNYSRENAEIKVFFDEGRIIDISFALFYTGDIQNKNIAKLVIEISVWSIDTHSRIMGLLIIEQPNEDIINAFSGAFNVLYNDKLKIDNGKSYYDIWLQ